MSLIPILSFLFSIHSLTLNASYIYIIRSLIVDYCLLLLFFYGPYSCPKYLYILFWLHLDHMCTNGKNEPNKMKWNSRSVQCCWWSSRSLRFIYQRSLYNMPYYIYIHILKGMTNDLIMMFISTEKERVYMRERERERLRDKKKYGKVMWRFLILWCDFILW